MSQCQIFRPEEIASVRRAGSILRACLEMLAKEVKPGITTVELDKLAEDFIRHHGGEPAFKGYHNFPATLCTSVNDECVHGIPSMRVLEEGDVVSLDCGVVVDELYTDACITVPVGQVSKDAQRLLTVTKQALEDAVAIIKEGTKVGDISATIQKTVERGECTPVPALTGPGPGRTLPPFPDIPKIGKAHTGAALPAWTVIAIEPIVSLGSGEVRDGGDGWTLNIADGSLAAHFEHTILVTPDGCEVLA